MRTRLCQESLFQWENTGKITTAGWFAAACSFPRLHDDPHSAHFYLNKIKSKQGNIRESLPPNKFLLMAQATLLWQRLPGNRQPFEPLRKVKKIICSVVNSNGHYRHVTSPKIINLTVLIW